MPQELLDQQTAGFHRPSFGLRTESRVRRRGRENSSRIITFITSRAHREATKTQLGLALAQGGSVNRRARAQNATRPTCSRWARDVREWLHKPSEGSHCETPHHLPRIQGHTGPRKRNSRNNIDRFIRPPRPSRWERGWESRREKGTLTSALSRRERGWELRREKRTLTPALSQRERGWELRWAT
jgi:hypothetical protein